MKIRSRSSEVHPREMHSLKKSGSTTTLLLLVPPLRHLLLQLLHLTSTFLIWQHRFWTPSPSTTRLTPHLQFVASTPTDDSEGPLLERDSWRIPATSSGVLQGTHIHRRLPKKLRRINLPNPLKTWSRLNTANTHTSFQNRNLSVYQNTSLGTTQSNSLRTHPPPSAPKSTRCRTMNKKNLTVSWTKTCARATSVPPSHPFPLLSSS